MRLNNKEKAEIKELFHKVYVGDIDEDFAVLRIYDMIENEICAKALWTYENQKTS